MQGGKQRFPKVVPVNKMAVNLPSGTTSIKDFSKKWINIMNFGPCSVLILQCTHLKMALILPYYT